MALWERVKEFCTWIFYEVPIKWNRHRGLQYHHLDYFYHYFSIILICWLLCHAISIIWVIMNLGCGYPLTRGFLKGFCIQPYRGPNHKVDWYLDLWRPNAAHGGYLDTPSPYIDNIMTSHLGVCDAEMALLHQISKISEMDEIPLGVDRDDVINSLSQVQAVASDLCPQVTNFSRAFCMEKDVINHAFRTFVEAYAMTITRAEYLDLDIVKHLFLPLIHLLRIANQYVLSPWLPEPRLYSQQVQSEINYQSKWFIRESTAAMNRIDATSPSARHLRDAKSQNTLQEAIEKINDYQRLLSQKLDSQMAERNCFQRLLPDPPKIVTLKQLTALGIRVQERILAVERSIVEYEDDNGRLRTQLQQLRQSIEHVHHFDFSPTGTIGIPSALLEHVQKPPFLLHRSEASSNAGGESVSSDGTRLTSHAHVYFYDLDEIDESRIPALRSVIAQLCKSRTNEHIVSGSLYMICHIWVTAATLSEVDIDTLGGVQRSWARERLEAIRRYEQRTGSDPESIARLAAVTLRDYKRGTPVPHSL